VTGPRALVVLGGGEHARVVIDVARSRPDLWTVVGFVDPLPCRETENATGLLRLGDDHEGLERARSGAYALVLGVGGTRAGEQRQRLLQVYADVPSPAWATIVHERAWVSPAALLGPGVLVAAGGLVNCGARLGAHAVVNTAAVVEHDVELGPFSQVAPGAVVGGATIVGEGSYLGLGSRIRDHVRIGRGVTVGMGAVVVADVEDGQTVVGVPARVR
jgi:acetyltransferase EpsM